MLNTGNLVSPAAIVELSIQVTYPVTSDQVSAARKRCGIPDGVDSPELAQKLAQAVTEDLVEGLSDIPGVVCRVQANIKQKSEDI